MSAEGKLLFRNLIQEQRFHPFLVEILAAGRYDTIPKFKLFDKHRLDELLQGVIQHLGKFEHLETYDPDCYRALHHGTGPVYFHIHISDKALLLSLPDIGKEMEVQYGSRIKRMKVPKINLKRRYDLIEKENEPEPKRPAKKLKIDKAEATRLFKKYVETKVGGDHNYFVDLERVPPSFKMTCSFCEKEVSICCQPTASGKPSFIPTNLKKHKCFKKVPAMAEITNEI